MTVSPMPLIGLEVENFKRLIAVNLVLTDDGLIEVRGKNKHGKSSLLDALEALLCGLRYAPSEPIRKGSEWSRVVGRVGDLIITRRWSDPEDQSKSKLTIESKDGAIYKSPQAMLEGLMSKMADPVRFMGLSDSQQVAEVLAMVDLGFDLAESKALEAGAVEERKDKGKEVKRLQGVVQSLRAEVGDEEPERVVVADLLAEMQAARKENVETVRLGNVAELLRGDYGGAVKYVSEKEERLENLRHALEQAEGDLKDAEHGRDKIEASVAEAEHTFDAREPVDLAPMQQRLVDAEAVNATAARFDELGARKKELAGAVKIHEGCELGVGAIRDRRTAALADVKFPVDGMGYDADNGRLTLHGLPLSQASGSELLTASVQLSMSGDPIIKVLWARDGSLLDDENKALLAKLVSDAEGWKMLLEVVDDKAEGPGIWIHDGTAGGPMVVEAEAEVEA